MLGPSLNWKTCCTAWKFFFPTDTLKLNFCSLKWVLMVYGSCILLQLGDKCDKPHQKVSTVRRKHLWNFLLADHCTAWWRIIISKDWPTAKDALGGSWGGLSQYPSPTRSRFISELSINCYFSRLFLWNVSLFLFKSITFCTLYCGTGMHTARGIFRFDHFLVPTVGRFVCCPNKAHVFNPEICPRYICCTRTQKEHHAEMLEIWIFPSCRWAMFQVLWSVLPESVGILTIVWWRCSRYPFPCFSQGCSLCICCTEEIFGNASKQEGTRSLSKLILVVWHRFCQNTLQTIFCYRCWLYCNHFH